MKNEEIQGFWKGVAIESLICGLIAGSIYWIFSGLTSDTFLALPLGMTYGLGIGLFIGFIIKPQKTYK